ncbi:MAG TPA: DegT/DnrJ/EryC1/StrS family aminotransferase [Bryobacteraceae bacterium]|jgi:dTDP-3-amino-3,4,6-trideoxy-alpha-D-glucose transaminase|nr:DegT/DnrJ/EryC1/StrS family aminotransferase [Bryobacteraceae bacterium]
MQDILFNDFARQWEDTRVEMLAAFERVGASGWYVLGREVVEFERALAVYWGVNRAVGVASGLDAIEIGLRALGCEEGDRVLTTPVSAFATTLAIVKLGAVPVFAPVDRYGLVDLAACDDVLRARPEIRFFVPVHLYGHALDAEQIGELRSRFDLKIVEDCAQSIGASFGGAVCGRAGQVAATSFYPTKNLGAMGDGGAILTGSEELGARCAEYRNYGQSAKYRHESIGYNSRLDELQAALLAVSLKKLPGWIERRRTIAKRYIEGIRNKAVLVPGPPPGSDSSWHLFPVLVQAEKKPAFFRWMRERGITTAEHYPKAIFDQPAMRAVAYENVPGAERARNFCHEQVSLPIHPYLTDEETARVIEAVNGWRAE